MTTSTPTQTTIDNTMIIALVCARGDYQRELVLSQAYERMSLADQHAVRLHMRMMVMLAREMPTREARIKHMVGQTFCGPHHYVTKDCVVVDEGTAVYIADLLDAETPVAVAVAAAP